MFNYFNLNRKYKTFGSNIVWNGYRMLLVRLSTSSSDCPWPGMQDTHRDTDWSVEGYCWFHPSSKRTYVCESVSDHHFGHFKCHLLLETIDVLDFPLNHWIRRERSLWIRPAKATQVTQASISQLLPCKKRGSQWSSIGILPDLGRYMVLRLGSTLGKLGLYIWVHRWRYRLLMAERATFCLEIEQDFPIQTWSYRHDFDISIGGRGTTTRNLSEVDRSDFSKCSDTLLADNASAYSYFGVSGDASGMIITTANGITSYKFRCADEHLCIHQRAEAMQRNAFSLWQEERALVNYWKKTGCSVWRKIVKATPFLKIFVRRGKNSHSHGRRVMIFGWLFAACGLQ